MNAAERMNSAQADRGRVPIPTPEPTDDISMAAEILNGPAEIPAPESTPSSSVSKVTLAIACTLVVLVAGWIVYKSAAAGSPPSTSPGPKSPPPTPPPAPSRPQTPSTESTSSPNSSPPTQRGSPPSPKTKPTSSRSHRSCVLFLVTSSAAAAVHSLDTRTTNRGGYLGFSLLKDSGVSGGSFAVLGLEGGKECVIVGTVYKNMTLKPTILDEYSKERSASPLVKPHNFMHSDDYLILEDEGGRVNQIRGTILLPSVCATASTVLGLERGKECAIVASNVLGLERAKECVIVGTVYKHMTLKSTILDEYSKERLASALVKPHNSMHSDEYLIREDESGTTKNLGSKVQSRRLSEPIKELDVLLTQLIAAGIPLDIMPGNANFTLPQQEPNKWD